MIELEERVRPAGRKAWCPRCRVVEMVDSRWRCVWCLSATMDGKKYPPRAARFASVRVVREAHRLHAEGATIMQAAAATIAQTGYADVSGYTMTLRECWALLGLPTRSRGVAQMLRARGDNPGYRPPRVRYRHDVTDAQLTAHYLETLSTVRTAEAFGMSQQGVYGRLKPIGVIVPHGARRRATIDNPNGGNHGTHD